MTLICCIISIGSSLLAPMWITSHLNKINMFLPVLVLSFNDVYHLHEGVDNSIKTFDSLLHYVIQHFVSVRSHRCLMLWLNTWNDPHVSQHYPWTSWQLLVLFIALKIATYIQRGKCFCFYNVSHTIKGATHQYQMVPISVKTCYFCHDWKSCT